MCVNIVDTVILNGKEQRVADLIYRGEVYRISKESFSAPSYIFSEGISAKDVGATFDKIDYNNIMAL